MNIHSIFKALLLFSLTVLILGSSSCQKGDGVTKVKEKTLHLNLRTEPISLDPRRGNDMVASQVQFMLFEGLVRLNHDMSISPAQAHAYEISEDGRTYTFHLGKTKWSDGTPVTANDFEMTWKSLLTGSFPSPDAYLLYPILNAEAARKNKVLSDAIGIHAPDPQTLVVELHTPTPHFLQIAASSVCLPVKETHPNWSTSVAHFVSNGPFLLKDWKFQEQLALKKNPTYRKTKDVQLDNILIDIIDRELVALHMYASGYYDIVGAPLSFFPAMIHQDLEKKNLLTFFPVATSKFLAFNTQKFPFNNTDIRRAFGLAVRRGSIVEHISQLKEEPALNIIPPVLRPGQSPALIGDADENAAKEALRRGMKTLKLKAQDLKPISLMYVTSEMNHLIAQELQQRWSEVLGVRINLENVDFKTLHERSAKGDFSIGNFTWVADYADAMNILERFDDPSNHRNYPKWHNTAYHELLASALKASSKKEYWEHLAAAEKIMMDEMPITCLYHGNYAFLIQPHVQHFMISPLGHIYFDQISLKD